MVPIAPTRMVCRLTLWHCCASACFNLVCCSVSLASCCSGRVSSQCLTWIRYTSQREGCIACMSLWWPFLVSSGSMQIASGLEQDQSSSAKRFGRSYKDSVLLATCAGKTRLCRAFVLHFQYLPECEYDVSSKITFAQGFDEEPGGNVMSFSHPVLNWSILTTTGLAESIWIWLSGWWQNKQDELVALP